MTEVLKNLISSKMAWGKTEAGKGWVKAFTLTENGIKLNVQTNLNDWSNPLYFTSLSSTGGSDWPIIGATTIYDSSKSGFSIYIANVNWNGVIYDKDPNFMKNTTVKFAEDFGLYVNWFAVDLV